MRNMHEKMRKGLKLCSSVDEITIVEKDIMPIELGGTLQLSEIVGK
jgi:hypothetical protein